MAQFGQFALVQTSGLESGRQHFQGGGTICRVGGRMGGWVAAQEGDRRQTHSSQCVPMHPGQKWVGRRRMNNRDSFIERE